VCLSTGRRSRLTGLAGGGGLSGVVPPSPATRPTRTDDDHGHDVVVTDEVRVPLLVDLAVGFGADDYANQGWRARARCRGTDPDWFHPPQGGSSTQQFRLCAGCPVRIECLEFALSDGEKMGIWGGTPETARRKARKHGWSAAELIERVDRARAPEIRRRLDHWERLALSGANVVERDTRDCDTAEGGRVLIRLAVAANRSRLRVKPLAMTNHSIQSGNRSRNRPRSRRDLPPE
jgi:WhiB family redox-sensing transcriptional regulator